MQDLDTIPKAFDITINCFITSKRYVLRTTNNTVLLGADIIILDEVKIVTILNGVKVKAVLSRSVFYASHPIFFFAMNFNPNKFNLKKL